MYDHNKCDIIYIPSSVLRTFYMMVRRPDIFVCARGDFKYIYTILV